MTPFPCVDGEFGLNDKLYWVVNGEIQPVILLMDTEDYFLADPLTGVGHHGYIREEQQENCFLHFKNALAACRQIQKASQT